MSARSEAPNDPRPYIRVALDLPMNPKLAAIEENFHQCGWAYICSLCYCGQSLTDGHFPLRAVLRMADVDRAQVMALVEQGLWHLPDHDCPNCEQPKPGHAVIHDYLQHQRSAAEIHDLSAKRREAGKKGAQKRWSPPKQAADAEVAPTPEMASAMALAMANGQQGLWQTDGNVMAEEIRGDETKTPPPEGGAKAPRRRRKKPQDDDPPSDPDAEERERNTKDVVAAFIDGAREKRRTVTGAVIGQVGATAKRILADGSVDLDKLIDAAFAMGRSGYKDLNQQLLRGADNDYQGRRRGSQHVPHRDPEDVSRYKTSRI